MVPTYPDYLVFLGFRSTRLFHLCLWRYLEDLILERRAVSVCALYYAVAEDGTVYYYVRSFVINLLNIILSDYCEAEIKNEVVLAVFVCYTVVSQLLIIF